VRHLPGWVGSLLLLAVAAAVAGFLLAFEWATWILAVYLVVFSNVDGR
jgi:hypothetical protein